MFGMYAKVVAKAGRRDAMVEVLWAASRLLEPLPGCLMYVAGGAKPITTRP